MTTNNLNISVYTDGGCTGNGKKHANASWAFAIVDQNNTVLHQDCRVVSSTATGPTASNNRGELTAILFALRYFEKSTNYNITLYSDSKYSINCITVWGPEWIKNPVILESKKNIDLICECIHLVKLICEKNNIYFKHIRSHQPEPLKGTPEWNNWFYNNLVDKLCVKLLT